ncbi:uncharacterized protein B0H18DRAFT_1103529 [Fomitopsis serialis]|uniref:uncharacterized protein n=1 Tax=Fomitopsis serialis TaxID=139415 RepID=UPI0020076F0F|nr:uncharacterized protein B0H18DRAFT_1103529 [Neoantrodia serialis]KAH9929192.1 hypothetical protein B0H18DRAFT_1103529 [Neoantrodia serialis]
MRHTLNLGPGPEHRQPRRAKASVVCIKTASAAACVKTFDQYVCLKTMHYDQPMRKQIPHGFNELCQTTAQSPVRAHPGDVGPATRVVGSRKQLYCRRAPRVRSVANTRLRRDTVHGLCTGTVPPLTGPRPDASSVDHEASQLWRAGGTTWLMLWLTFIAGHVPTSRIHTICGERIQTLYRPSGTNNPGPPERNIPEIRTQILNRPNRVELDIPGMPEPNLKL